jgi:hypothetical protein
LGFRLYVPPLYLFLSIVVVWGRPGPSSLSKKKKKKLFHIVLLYININVTRTSNWLRFWESNKKSIYAGKLYV